MIQFPRSEKIYVPGEINKLQVGMRRVLLRDTVQVGADGKRQTKPNSPLVVYDTTGCYSDPRLAGRCDEEAPSIREEWYGKRKDLRRDEERGLYRAKPGKRITQLSYAKRRVITPEMEYVAIRENQQIETLGLKSYITPEFVRKELVAGRAVIPANVNHACLEPMVIGGRFLVKVDHPIDYPEGIPSPAVALKERLLRGLTLGCDTFTALFEREGRTEEEVGEQLRRLLSWSPVPVGVNPLLTATLALPEEEGAGAMDWPLFRDKLIELCERGVDIVRLYPAISPAACERLRHRLLRPRSSEHRFWDQWFLAHKGEENFLAVHFEELCEILGSFDVTLSLGDGMRAVSIYDAVADTLRQEELRCVRELVRRAWDLQVQVLVETAGHVPMDRIQEETKEVRYMSHGAPLFTFGPLPTNAALGLDPLFRAMGGAYAAWQGASLLCGFAPEEVMCQTDQERRMSDRALVMAKVAAHMADVAKSHPGAALRDHAICKALAEGNRMADAELLSLVPKGFSVSASRK